jgi:hypothetical protein
VREGDVVALAGRADQAHRIAQGVARGVDFRAQAAAGATKALGNLRPRRPGRGRKLFPTKIAGNPLNSHDSHERMAIITLTKVVQHVVWVLIGAFHVRRIARPALH